MSWRSAWRAGLRRVALRLVMAAGVLIALASLGSKPLLVSALLASVVMAIGFVPMRMISKHGVTSLPAVWMGATTLRLFAAIGAIVVLIVGKTMPAGEVVLGVIGTYLVLLAIETASLIQLVRRIETLKD